MVTLSSTRKSRRAFGEAESRNVRAPSSSRLHMASGKTDSSSYPTSILKSLSFSAITKRSALPPVWRPRPSFLKSSEACCSIVVSAGSCFSSTIATWMPVASCTHRVEERSARS